MKIESDVLAATPVQDDHVAHLMTSPITDPSEGHEHTTRQAIVRLLLESGPVTAGHISAQLGLSVPGVRRHLDVLIDTGDVEVYIPKPRTPLRRGRPAKKFQLTSLGREKIGHSYDDLARDALRYVRDLGGEDALCHFARQRTQSILAEVTSVSHASNKTIEDTIHAIVRALTKAGYTASIRSVEGKIPGIQILRHHCPITNVAREFPELCRVETQVIAELLHTHVQQVATIANGNYLCSTYIPLPERSNTDISSDRLFTHYHPSSVS